MRCVSWRPVEADGDHTQHRPGTCRRCWTTCRARVEPGQYRCHACAVALARHPSAWVRMCLVAEEVGAPPDVLELLTFDADETVAAAARVAMLGSPALVGGIDWED